jgi:hypothetical protein
MGGGPNACCGTPATRISTRIAVRSEGASRRISLPSISGPGPPPADVGCGLRSVERVPEVQLYTDATHPRRGVWRSVQPGHVAGHVLNSVLKVTSHGYRGCLSAFSKPGGTVRSSTCFAASQALGPPRAFLRPTRARVTQPPGARIVANITAGFGSIFRVRSVCVDYVGNSGSCASSMVTPRS